MIENWYRFEPLECGILKNISMKSRRLSSIPNPNPRLVVICCTRDRCPNCQACECSMVVGSELASVEIDHLLKAFTTRYFGFPVEDYFRAGDIGLA